MKILRLVLLLLPPVCCAQQQVIRLHAGESITLPENPEPALHPEKAGFWTFRGSDDPVLRSNREAFHDKTWGVTQSIWLGTIVYDVELTHQGLAHHNCVERNWDTGSLPGHPSRGALYLSALPEYAAGTGLNYVMLRFFGKPLIFEFPTYAAVQHIRGGSAWLMNCW
jgi:hypothetical protein